VPPELGPELEVGLELELELGSELEPPPQPASAAAIAKHAQGMRGRRQVLSNSADKVIGAGE
jgi:hypothetical protein